MPKSYGLASVTAPQGHPPAPEDAACDFTSEEVETLVAAGARPVGLGPLRLRVETAAVAIMSCVSMTHPRTQPPGC